MIMSGEMIQDYVRGMKRVGQHCNRSLKLAVLVCNKFMEVCGNLVID